jgi:ribosome biogenesis protein BRX1
MPSKKKQRKDRKAEAAQEKRDAQNASHEDAPNEDDDEAEMAALRAELAATEKAHQTEKKAKARARTAAAAAAANEDDESESESENEAPVPGKQKRKRPAAEVAPARVKYQNKQRCLVVCSRGASARHRHLLEDLRRLMPHHKADSKMDSKGDPRQLNEVCELKSCNGCLYLEARKRTDLYLWLARPPTGPSCKFLVQNVHTMDELKLTGNCGHGTRALLCFDATFDAEPHWRAIKDLLSVTFGVPRGHPKSKPFFDRCMSFAIDDGKVWIRHYQVVDDTLDDADAKV